MCECTVTILHLRQMPLSNGMLLRSNPTYLGAIENWIRVRETKVLYISVYRWCCSHIAAGLQELHKQLLAAMGTICNAKYHIQQTSWWSRRVWSCLTWLSTATQQVWIERSASVCHNGDSIIPVGVSWFLWLPPMVLLHLTARQPTQMEVSATPISESRKWDTRNSCRNYKHDNSFSWIRISLLLDSQWKLFQCVLQNWWIRVSLPCFINSNTLSLGRGYCLLCTQAVTRALVLQELPQATPSISLSNCIFISCHEPFWNGILSELLDRTTLHCPNQCYGVHQCSHVCVLLWDDWPLWNQDEINISMATRHNVPWWPPQVCTYSLWQSCWKVSWCETTFGYSMADSHWETFNLPHTGPSRLEGLLVWNSHWVHTERPMSVSHQDTFQPRWPCMSIMYSTSYLSLSS